MKRVLAFLISLLIIFSIPLTAIADDNATSGSGDTTGAAEGRGYYSGREWMYKVSVFVGLSDEADKNVELVSNFKSMGNPIIVKPPSFQVNPNALFGNTSKIYYLRGATLKPIKKKDINFINDSKVPKIPITHGGNIGAVKSYFGDTETLNSFIDAYAKYNGTTPEGLVSNLTFRINGENKKLPPEDVLPIKIDGKYQNKVPWAIVYEPICIAHLKDKKTHLAFTATEFSIAQKKGWFDFYSTKNGEWIDSMTFSDLPNAVVLEESWFGYPVVPALADRVKWSPDRVIKGGGWGMRMLKANAKEEPEPDPDPINYDVEYRTDTDVITSVMVYANDDITPDDRHINPYNPRKNTAEVVIEANGFRKTTTVVMPSNKSELVWLKWHTPKEPGQVDISVSLSGNRAARLEGGARSATIKANIVELVEKTPPPIRINGEDGKPLRKPDFWVKPSPKPIRKEMKKWHEYDCDWHANWVDVPYDVWVDDDDDPDGGYYETEYRQEDHGWWTFERNDYYARIFVEFNIKPNRRAAKTKKTIDDWYMWSGNGVEAELKTRLSTNASKSRDVTKIQNAITRFPEFHYEKYNRVLEETEDDVFEFKENRYSTYKLRSHYIPFWYHDNDDFEIYAHGFDAWTPAGMLEASATDKVMIRGNVYNDGWHIAPLPVD